MKVSVASEYAGSRLPSRSQDETVSETGQGTSSSRGVSSEFGRRFEGGDRERCLEPYDVGGFSCCSKLLLDDALSETISQATVSALGENDGQGQARVGGFDPALGFGPEGDYWRTLPPRDPSKSVQARLAEFIEVHPEPWPRPSLPRWPPRLGQMKHRRKGQRGPSHMLPGA